MLLPGKVAWSRGLLHGGCLCTVMSWDPAGPATWSLGMQDGGVALRAQQGCCPDGQLVLSHLTQPL